MLLEVLPVFSSSFSELVVGGDALTRVLAAEVALHFKDALVLVVDTFCDTLLYVFVHG